jgi:hypothetical protein
VKGGEMTQTLYALMNKRKKTCILGPLQIVFFIKATMALAKKKKKKKVKINFYRTLEINPRFTAIWENIYTGKTAGSWQEHGACGPVTCCVPYLLPSTTVSLGVNTI